MTANTDTFSGNVFSDIGTGQVISLTEDSTHVFISTTLQFAATQAWFEKVGILREGAITFENCTGSDPVYLASEACRRGQNPRDFYRYRWMGVFAQGGGWFYHKGLLTQLKLNVRQVSPAASTTLKIDCNVFDATTLVLDGVLEFAFNCNTAGERIITVGNYTGQQSGDTITLNSVSKTSIPPGQIWNGQSQWFFQNLNPSGFSVYQLPVIDMELTFDLGKIDTVTYPRLGDPDAGTNLIAATVTELP
jgi:hypothetical protein